MKVLSDVNVKKVNSKTLQIKISHELRVKPLTVSQIPAFLVIDAYSHLSYIIRFFSFFVKERPNRSDSLQTVWGRQLIKCRFNQLKRFVISTAS